MKLTIGGVLLCAAFTGCATEPPSHVYIADLPRSHRAAIVESDSSCDGAGAREQRDPSSHCYIDRRKSKD